jgi:putative serine protease PepD
VGGRPSLWINGDGAREADGGPFSEARWRRQAAEARRPSTPDAEPPAAAPARRRPWLLLAAVTVSLLALGLSALALVEGGADDAEPTLPAAGGTLPPSAIGRVYEAAGPAVVSVQAGNASGTGFVVRSDGLVVTNAHVVGGEEQVQLRFGDRGRQLDAEVLGSDPSSDLAVLRVDPGSARPLRPLRLADSDRVRVGDSVVAIGHPFGLDRTATAGIVSGVGREIRAPNGFEIDEVIQTDAPINPGNSGGPLLDAHGRVVGVNSQIATAGARGNVGIGFAVPSNTVREVLPKLARGERIEHPWLGVSTAPGPDGAVVVEVTPGSPAEDAGVEPGDVIAEVDGQPVRDPDDLADAVAAAAPGDELTVVVSSAGESTTLTIELGVRPGP